MWRETSVSLILFLVSYPNQQKYFFFHAIAMWWPVHAVYPIQLLSMILNLIIFDNKSQFYGGLCLRMSLSWIGYTFKGCVVCTMKIVDSIYLTSLLFSFFFFDRCMHLTLRKLLIGEVILSLCYDAYVLSMLVNNWWTREKKTIAPSHIQMMRMKLKEKNVFAAIV